MKEFNPTSSLQELHPVQLRTQSKSIYIAREPLTLDARRQALHSETREAVSEYYGKLLTRSWIPTKLPFREMQRLGGRLSEDTVTLLEGFMGVENFIGDFVMALLDAYQGDRHLKLFARFWGAEESRHGQALELVLIHSGKRTKDQMNEHDDKISGKLWLPSQHRGVYGALGGIVYSTMQEKETYLDYVRLRERVRNEYGLPEWRTRQEFRWGREIGVSEAISKISRDEIAHHGTYLRLLRAWLCYFPDETIEKIKEIRDAFAMPAMNLLPNKLAFLKAILRTELATKELQESEVFKPLLKSLDLTEDDLQLVA